MNRRESFKILGLTVAGLFLPKFKRECNRIIFEDGSTTFYSHGISDPGHNHCYCQGFCSGHHHTINDPGHSHIMLPPPPSLL